MPKSDSGERHADGNKTIISQVLSLGWYYPLEIAVAIVVYAVVTQILALLDVVGEDVFSRYETIVLLLVLVVLIIGVVVMLNTARARVSAAEILDEMRRQNAKKR